MATKRERGGSFTSCTSSALCCTLLGQKGATRNGIATAGTMVAKTDTAEFYIIKYKVTDMYNY